MILKLNHRIFLKLNIYFSLINDIKSVQKERMGNFFITYIVPSPLQSDRNYLKCEKKYHVNQRQNCKFCFKSKKQLVIKTFDCLTMKPFEIFYTENKFQLYKIRQAKATLDSYISCNTALPFVLQRINQLTLCPRHISLKRFELCNYKYNG